MHSHEVLEEWADRSGEYSPDYYAYYGPNETSEQVRARLDSVVGSDAAVLELGCSSGRHLAHLHEHGYRDLHGVDVNDDAFDVMADAYPDLFEAGRFYVETIEDAVSDFADDRFDAVYSVETLQHVHPDHEWVFDEVARIADDLLVTAEIETGSNGSADEVAACEDEPAVNFVDDGLPLYYRSWDRVFADRGFEQVDVESLDRDTLRVFRPA